LGKHDHDVVGNWPWSRAVDDEEVAAGPPGEGQTAGAAAARSWYIDLHVLARFLEIGEGLLIVAACSFSTEKDAKMACTQCRGARYRHLELVLVRGIKKIVPRRRRFKFAWRERGVGMKHTADRRAIAGHCPSAIA